MFFVLFSKDSLQLSGAMKNLNKKQQLLVALRNRNSFYLTGALRSHFPEWI